MIKVLTIIIFYDIIVLTHLIIYFFLSRMLYNHFLLIQTIYLFYNG